MMVSLMHVQYNGHCLNAYHNVNSLLAIVIGWEQLRYTTFESAGSVQLCANISSPSDSVGIELVPFSLTVQYSDISAGKLII